MLARIFILISLIIPTITYSQFNLSTKILDVCNINQLDNCETFFNKTLININEEETILKIINSSTKYTYYIVESDYDEEEELFIFSLVRDDEKDYLGIYNPSQNNFRMLFKEEDETYMTIFYN